MGFSYNYLGLCCDFCSNAGPQQNVRKISCPYGFCQAGACCNVCFKAKKHLSSSCGDGTHKEVCKPLHEEFIKKESEEKNLLDQGFFLRCAALSHGEDTVKVIFRNKEGIEKGAFMTHAAYNKFPLGVPVKMEQYKITCMGKNADLNNLEVLV